MVRDMLRNGSQPKDTMHKAKTVMVVGMGVVEESATSVKKPAAETAKNIFVVTKERVPYGIDASRKNISDYDDIFENIAKDEFVGILRYTDGEKFATNQYKAADFEEAPAFGTALSVGTDGKWQKAGSAVASKYTFAGMHNDNGHVLVMIKVNADEVTNA